MASSIGERRLPRDLLVLPYDQGIPERRPPHRKADKPRHAGCRGEPGVDVGFVLTWPEDDATNFVAQAAFPHENVYMRLHDELGTIDEDHLFAA
jgi:hypothetical protein